MDIRKFMVQGAKKGDNAKGSTKPATSSSLSSEKEGTKSKSPAKKAEDGEGTNKQSRSRIRNLKSEDEDYDPSSSTETKKSPKKSPAKVSPAKSSSAKPTKSDASTSKSAASPKKTVKNKVMDLDDADFEEATEQVAKTQTSKKAAEKKTPSKKRGHDEITEEEKHKPTPAAKPKSVKEEDLAEDKDTAKKARSSKAKTDTKAEAPAEQPKKRKWFPGMRNTGALNPGHKEVPEGTPTCLEGLSFVITGLLEELSREEAEDLIKRCGGMVRTNVSSKTSYAVVGADAGETKKKQIAQHNTKILDEDGLFELIRTRSAKQEEFDVEKPSASPKKKASPKKASAPKAEEPKKPEETKPVASTSAARSIIMPAVPAQQHESALWTTRYAPKRSSDIIGNSTAINSLREWLKYWEEYHLHKPKTAPAKKGAGEKPKGRKPSEDEFKTKKAVLISGPPGIGKTTTARLVSQELGFDVVEFNASDVRSRKHLKEHVAEMINNRSLSEFFTGTKKMGEKQKKYVLIMDEIDGMGRGDRAGTGELIQMIKDTKIPIICICNDRYSPKLKSLVNYCVDLKFQRPTKLQIAKRIEEICKKEGLSMNQPTAQMFAESMNNDIRSIINNLQIWSTTHSDFSYDDVKHKVTSEANKNVDIGVFDIIGKFLMPQKNYRITEQLEFFYMDSDLVPLFVQENYVNVSPRNISPSEALDRYAEAADSISESDIVNYKMRTGSSWGLYSTYALHSTLRPAHYVRGGIAMTPQYGGGLWRFPAWLGKTSTTNKNLRLLTQLHKSASVTATGTKTDINLDYLPIWKESLVHPLAERGKEGIDDVIKLMDDYQLTREDFDTIQELASFGLTKKAKAAALNIDTSVKTAFTRKYNATHKSVTVSKSGAGSRIETKEDELKPDEDTYGEVGEDEDEEAELEGLEGEEAEKKRAEKELMKNPLVKQSKAKRATANSKAKGKASAYSSSITPAKKRSAPAKKKTSKKDEDDDFIDDDEIEEYGDDVIDSDDEDDEEDEKPASKKKRTTAASTATATKKRPTTATKKRPATATLQFKKT